jgi:opacity protein-like surface antigen
MPRFFGRLLVGTGALVIAATAHAQGASNAPDRPWKVGGALGGTIPLGDFSDGADLGWHLGGLFEYKQPSFPVTWRGELTYHRNGLKDDFFSGQIPGVGNLDGNFSMINFVANALYPFGDKAKTSHPYIIGGLGLYRVKATASYQGIDISDSQTKFGINVGGGVEFALSGFDAFIEARYHSVFTDNNSTNFIPLSFGFKF